eukprot:GFUD01053043.1.p1 GENE.GFUD01053043.1~~GFUD01053043.1.p1  ORF type:complete len:107 (+),score=7.32 GFUD01053043.1:123-443(+)
MPSEVQFKEPCSADLLKTETCPAIKPDTKENCPPFKKGVCIIEIRCYCSFKKQIYDLPGNPARADFFTEKILYFKIVEIEYFLVYWLHFTQSLKFWFQQQIINHDG